jgi:hypothetical protein
LHRQQFEQEEQAANIRNSTKVSTDAMAAQIKAMSDQIAQLTKAIANKENAPNGSRSRGGIDNSGSRERDKGQARYVAVQYTKPRSMGSYCSLHGHECHLQVETTQPQHDGNLE